MLLLGQIVSVNRYIVMVTMLVNLIKQQLGAKCIRIADRIDQAVQEYVMCGGDRLPQQGELADELGVTLGLSVEGMQRPKRSILEL